MTESYPRSLILMAVCREDCGVGERYLIRCPGTGRFELGIFMEDATFLVFNSHGFAYYSADAIYEVPK